MNLIRPKIPRLCRKAPLTETKLNKEEGSGTPRKQAGRTTTLQQHFNILRDGRKVLYPGKQTSCYRDGGHFRMRKSSQKSQLWWE